MIVVDSSVWIAQLRGLDTEGVRKFEALPSLDDVLVGDLVLLEVLQGARSDADAARIERNLGRFRIETMLSPSGAARAARNYRQLRSLGVTVRRTIDIIIGTFCIEGGHRLLHDDRDFDAMVRHLGLLVL